MCMEDVRLGRKTAVVEHLFALDGTSQLAIDADPNRVMLLLNSDQVNAIFLSLNPTSKLGQGIVLGPGLPSLTLTIQDHGQLVTKSWYAFGTTGTVFTWYEGRLEET